MDDNYTPGPWIECRGSDHTGCICGLVWSETDDVPIASCDMRVWHDGPERFLELPERQANARLIAAAPDLYEALKLIEADYTTIALHKDTRTAIEAALKKARGL